jgi:GT2 family glycosyltransferase
VSQEPKISIIIPTLHLTRPLNKKRFFVPRYTLAEVLNDIHQNVKVAHEVIVVCNGQQPDLVDFVTQHPHIDRYCLNSVNVGVARSWNMGVEMAQGEALCFVNDDVQIGPDGLESLHQVLMGDESIAQVGPVGAKWKGAEHDCFVGEQQQEDADAIAGFLFMMRTEAFRKAGGFDPFYSPAGFEEIDMCFRLRALGWRCVVVPRLDLKHHHHHGVSNYRSEVSYLGKTIDTESLHLRNKDYFERKWLKK